MIDSSTHFGHSDIFLKTFISSWENFNLIFRLSDFSQNTRSSGSTAEAAAYVEIRVPDENGRSVFGVGIDTSITLAPIKAVISAINRI